jgi:hypothetical protein
MCDTTALRNFLLGIAVAIVLAIALIIAAAITNGSFWLAWQSPGWMLAAAAAAAAAVLLCGFALDALDTVCTCTGARCSSQCANLRNVLNTARAVLGIQAMACLAAAAQAWIPVAGQIVMWTIVGAFVLQAALIVSAIAFLTQLDGCASAPATTPGFPPSGPVGPGGLPIG